MRIDLALEHLARQFHVADVANGGGVDPAAVFDHQIDHGLVGACVRGEPPL